MMIERATESVIPQLAHPLFAVATGIYQQYVDATARLRPALRRSLLGPVQRAAELIAGALLSQDRAHAWRQLDAASRAIGKCAGRLACEGRQHLGADVIVTMQTALRALHGALEPALQSVQKEVHGEPAPVPERVSAKDALVTVAPPVREVTEARGDKVVPRPSAITDEAVVKPRSAGGARTRDSRSSTGRSRGGQPQTPHA